MSPSKRGQAGADGLSGLSATEVAALRAALKEALRATDGTSADIEERLRVIQSRLLAAIKGSAAGAASRPQRPD